MRSARLLLGQIIRRLRRDWWIILLTTFAALGLSFLPVAPGSLEEPENEAAASASFYMSFPNADGQQLIANAKYLIPGYVQIIDGQTLLQRVIDAMSLPLHWSELDDMVTPSQIGDTTLIQVDIKGDSALPLESILDEIVLQFSMLLETLDSSPDAPVVLPVQQGFSRFDRATTNQPPNKVVFSPLRVFLSALIGTFTGLCIVTLRTLRKGVVLTAIDAENMLGIPPLIEHEIDLDEAESADELLLAAYARRGSLNGVWTVLSLCSDERVAAPLATQLAATVTALGFKVRLIDADFEEQRLTRLLAFNGTPGLSDAVKAESTDLSIYARSTPHGYSFVPAGTDSAGARRAAFAINLQFSSAVPAEAVTIIHGGSILNLAATTLVAKSDLTLLTVTVGGTNAKDLNRAADRITELGMSPDFLVALHEPSNATLEA
jgi:capsular polysaccharide biosynthesis protein